MRTLWFKGIYVAPILDGSKTVTNRTAKCRLQAGDLVDATVGPRPPFARLEILSRSDIAPTEDGETVRLKFRVIPPQ